jgi:hypothetical protein
MSLVEKIAGLLIVVIVLGSVLLIIGKIQGSLNVVSAGKTTICIGICCIVITFIVYFKIKEYEIELNEIKFADKYLSTID